MSTLEQLATAVSQADVDATQKILAETKTLNTSFSKCVALLWPEFSNSESLKFMNAYYSRQSYDYTLDSPLPQTSKEDENNDLIVYIESSLKSIIDVAIFESLDFSKVEDFFKARTLVVNQSIPNDILYNMPLAKHLDLLHDPWVNGILKPFYYFQKTQSNSIKLIKDFDKSLPITILKQMFEELSFIQSEKLNFTNHQLKPYMNYTSTQNIFLENFIEENLNPIPYETLQFLIQHPLLDENQDLYFEKLLKNIWSNFQHYSIDQLSTCLHGFSKKDDMYISLPIGLKNINDLLYYLVIAKELNFSDFNKIIDLENNKNDMQPIYFSFVCDSFFKNKSKTLENDPWFLESSLFGKIDSKDKQMLITESLIKHDRMHDLNVYCKGNVNSDFLLHHFWKLFHKANNGFPTNSNIIQCHKILELLNDSKLSILLDLVQFISSNFPNLELISNEPFKPSHILQLNNSPLLLIEKLLRYNELQYKSPEDTMQVIKKLFAALDISDIDDIELQATVLSSHIEVALAKNNFNFAYNLALQLLDNKFASKFWYVILQVGKFLDVDNWPDLETPTEIIFLQMEILSKLLMVIPADDMESAVSEYGRLELELSTRELTNDEYSLDNHLRYNNQNNYEKIINSFKSNISSLLND